MNRQTDIGIGREGDRLTQSERERETDRRRYRQTERQNYRKRAYCSYISISISISVFKPHAFLISGQ